MGALHREQEEGQKRVIFPGCHCRLCALSWASATGLAGEGFSPIESRAEDKHSHAGFDQAPLIATGSTNYQSHPAWPQFSTATMQFIIQTGIHLRVTVIITPGQQSKLGLR